MALEKSSTSHLEAANKSGIYKLNLVEKVKYIITSVSEDQSILVSYLIYMDS